MPYVSPLQSMSDEVDSQNDALIKDHEKRSEHAKSALALAELRLETLTEGKFQDQINIEAKLEAFEKKVEALNQNFKNQEVLEVMSEACEEIRQDFIHQMTYHKVIFSLENTVNLFDQVLLALAKVLSETPEKYADLSADFLSWLEQSGVPRYVQKAYAHKAEKEFASAVILTLIEKIPEKLGDVFDDPKLRILFSEKEIETFLFNAKECESARLAEGIFVQIQSTIFVNEDFENAVEKVSEFISTNPQNLDPNVLKIVEILFQLFVQKEALELEAGKQELLYQKLVKIQGLVIENKDEEAFIALLQSGIKKEAPEIFQQILPAMASGKKDQDFRGFVELIKQKTTSKFDVVIAFLAGVIDQNQCELLEQIIQLDPIDPSVFFLKQTFKKIIDLNRNDDVAYADIVAVFTEFVNAKNDQQSVHQIKKILASFEVQNKE